MQRVSQWGRAWIASSLLTCLQGSHSPHPVVNKVLLQETIVDMGSNAAIITQVLCLGIGLHIYKIDLPAAV